MNEQFFMENMNEQEDSSNIEFQDDFEGLTFECLKLSCLTSMKAPM